MRMPCISHLCAIQNARETQYEANYFDTKLRRKMEKTIDECVERFSAKWKKFATKQNAMRKCNETIESFLCVRFGY